MPHVQIIILQMKVTSVQFLGSFEADSVGRVRDGVLELNFKHGFLKELLKHMEGNDDALPDKRAVNPM